MKIDETTLLTEFKQGKDRAFSRLYDTYYRPVCYFAFNLVGEMQQAEDITSEIFSKLWTLRLNFGSIPQIKSFLYTAARNASLNYLKSLKVRTSTHEELLYLAEHEDDFILSKMMRAQLLQFIHEEVERFPGKVKTVFKLVFEEELSTREIALKLNMPEQSVRNAKTRALEILRHTLLKKKALYALVLLSVVPHW